MNGINISIFFLIFLLKLSTSDRILLIVDNIAIEKTHSKFIHSLKERGHSITVKLFDDSSLGLMTYGEFSYDHLILFAPSADDFGGSVSISEIVKFIDDGGNVLVAAAPNPGEAVRKLAAEIGFELDADKTRVIDHHNYLKALDDGSHTTLVIPTNRIIDASLITGPRQALTPVVFRGIALSSDSQSPLHHIIMTASTSAYSFDPNLSVNEYPLAIGKSTILIGAIQARNNARVVVSGSLDLFSDDFFAAQIETTTKSGNQEMVSHMSKWVLHESGVLRVKSVKHHIVDQKDPPVEYTIKEDVKYEIAIEELKEKKWVPFKGTDVQLEFVRIDPFIRTTLVNKEGKLTAQIRIPDVYGVYKFLVDYHRLGYTHLYNIQQVSVRPLTHTQYERFSRCAYPYYVSAYSMMIGVVIFSFVVLYYNDQHISQSK